MNLERGTIFWRKPQGLNYPLISVNGGVGTDKIVEAVYASALDEAIKEETVDLIDRGSWRIMQILQHGVIVTLNGQILAEQLPDLASQDRNILNLDRNIFSFSKMLSMREIAGLELTISTPQSEFVVVDREAEKYLGYSQVTPRGGIFFRFIKGRNIFYHHTKFETCLTSIVNKMQTPDRQKVISSSGIVTQTLFDIANTYGRGYIG